MTDAEQARGALGASAFSLPRFQVAPQELMSHPDSHLVESTPPVVLPTPQGLFAIKAWAFADGSEHLSATALAPDTPLDAGSTLDMSALFAGEQAHAVRVHSECATGDLLGSYRCDCGPQLEQGMQLLAELGGTLLYIRQHEGRGIGLINKLRAYALQDMGLDTVDANLALGLPQEARDYRQAAVILRELGLTRIRLVTNNPAKKAALEELGIRVVEMLPDQIQARPENEKYLATKRERMNHRLAS